MTYEKQTWANGDTITAPKLNNIEGGVEDMNNSYEKQTWVTGEVITADKLNHIEDGIANGGEDFAKLIDRSIVTVNIPNGITSVGRYAFYGCSNLTSVTIPSSVTSIDGSAFQNCSSLTSITIPSSVTSIGGYAFGACSKLENIMVEATSPPSISGTTFNGVPATANIYVPAESVNAYKAASSWKMRADYIQAIQE